jgi:hypothetical protein
VPVARSDQRPPSRPDAAPDQRAWIRSGIVGVDDPVAPQLLVELQHVDAGLDGDRAVDEIDIEDLVHSFDVDENSAGHGHGPIRQPSAAGAWHNRNLVGVCELYDLGYLLGRLRQNDDIRDVLVPPVHGEGSGHACPVVETRFVRQNVVGTEDAPQLIGDRVGQRDHTHLCTPP